MRRYGAMMLSESGDDRRNIMATIIQQIHPVAHLPLVLGVLRRLEVATIIDRLIPPHPAHRLSCGRGVEALVLAILDGHHAFYKARACTGTRLCCQRLCTVWASTDSVASTRLSCPRGGAAYHNCGIPRLIRKFGFMAQCRQEAGRTEIFA